MKPHREEGEGRYTARRERSSKRQGSTRDYICRFELGNRLKLQEACGMVRKNEEKTEKAKQRKIAVVRECPWAGGGCFTVYSCVMKRST